MWKIIKWIMGITVLLAIGLTWLESANETRALNELKQSDPEQYLIILKDSDQIKWLRALKELRPAQYGQELQLRITAAKDLPADKLKENLDAYKTLAELEPDNQAFSDKVESYKGKLKAHENWDKLCNDSKVEAFQKAELLVKAQLKAPRTAKMSSYGQTNIKLYKGCEYEVRGHVDAQNSFGAQIRSNYTVHLKRNQGGWAVKDLRIQ